MFTFRQTKYDVPNGKHTLVGEIRPYLYNKQGVSKATETTIRMQQGEMSSLYGMPPDRDIIIENSTAQAMNMMGSKMTETKMRNHNFQKEEGSIDFFSDPRVTAFMDNSVPMQETIEPERVHKTSRPTPRQEDDDIVEPAFAKGIQTEPENKSVHNDPENKNKSSRTKDDGVVAEPTKKKLKNLKLNLMYKKSINY